MERERPSERSSLQEALVTALRDSIEDTVVSPRTFFADWYCRRGTPLFFLFKKNLRVTNIQFAELVSLIQSDAEVGNGRQPRDLQFLTRREFNGALAGIASAVAAREPEQLPTAVASLYGDLLQRLVIVEPYFSSCNLFLPPGMSVDLATICARSGYIHSCGRNVWTRNTRKASTAELLTNLKRRIRATKRPDGPVFFAVYSHEDFSQWDRNDEAPQDGLDDVKLHIEKYFIEDSSLVEVIREIQRAFPRELVVAEPGNYREAHISYRQKALLDRSRTLWLITDRSIASDGRQPGASHYFICFEQQFKNENPLHIFDENKPAWVAHTTIPHTLMGALINITRPDWPTGPVRFADPFVGTGTSILEMCKEESAEVSGADLSVMSPLLFEDNAALFSAPLDELKRLNKKASKLHSDLLSISKREGAPVGDATCPEYRKASIEINRLQGESPVDGVEFNEATLRAFRKMSSDGRALRYLALRTLIRNGAGIRRGTKNWFSASAKECAEWLAQLNSFISLRSRQEGAEVVGSRTFIEYVGNYSMSVSIGRHAFDKLLSTHTGSQLVTKRDALDLPERSCDLVVTDPPYGFNTNDDAEELATLYRSMIPVLIRAVLPEGQLVFCLPEISHSGRRVRFFAQREMVTQQVLFEAGRLEAEVVIPAQALPGPTSLFRPPFYWESARALRRSILHFRVRERRGNATGGGENRPRSGRP